MDHKNELLHFNPNHDPKSGQFTSGKGGSKIASRPTGDAKYQNPDGTLTRKGKKRVRKAMSVYNKMNEASDLSSKKSAEKKFDKMSYKMTPSELAELTNKVIADQTIRDIYAQNQQKAINIKNMSKSKYDLSPKETVDLANSVINTMGSLSNFYFNYRNSRINLDTNRFKREQESAKAVQETEKGKQQQLKTLTNQMDAFEKGRAYNSTIKNLKNENSNLKNENSNLQSKNSGYQSQIDTLKTQNDNLNAFANSVKNRTTSLNSGNNAQSLVSKYNSSYTNKNQAAKINNMMQTDFSKAVGASTQSKSANQAKNINAMMQSDFSKIVNKDQASKINNMMQSDFSKISKSTISTGKSTTNSIIQSYTESDFTRLTGRW